jgi:carbon-monoxide dehydrogenase large subunit
MIQYNNEAVSRLEDWRLITGQGRFTADQTLPEQCYAAFFRSERAHAHILALHFDKARAQPGVIAVFSGSDILEVGYTTAPCMLTFAGKNGMKASIPPRPALAIGTVRHVGEAVALVVAESEAAAIDALSWIEVEYEDLPVLTNPYEAIDRPSVQLHETVSNNMPFEFEIGDFSEVSKQRDVADHVTRLKLSSTRVIASPMEPRACLVAYDKKNDHYTVQVCSQGVAMMRWQLSRYTGIAEGRISVKTGDVGGGFGQRSMAYPEYCALMLAAYRVGRPVKWVSSRSEGFLADGHGRGNEIEASLALDKDGRFLALALDWVTDQGAYLTRSGPVGHIKNPCASLTGVYRIGALYARFRVAMTNTAPITAYRGAGRPDMAYVMERLVNQAALETGRDPLQLRRLNFLQPEDFPYRLPTGSVYEKADVPGLLEQALSLADWQGFEQRRLESESRGLLRGRGLATVIEGTSQGMVAKDEILLECDRDGRLTIHSVSQSQGQGHATSFALIVAAVLQIAPERIRLQQGNSDNNLIGNQTGGSRSTVGAGSVCSLAAQKMIKEGKSLAAERWGIEPSQVNYSNGIFISTLTSKALLLEQLACTDSWCVKAEANFGATFPNGCHVAEVEIDPDTGKAQIVAYTAIDDCGVVISQTLVEGQLQGAVAQGAGQVFGEQILYETHSGQLLTGSFSDYIMPRAGVLPDMQMASRPVSSSVSPLGVKGVGESGCTASLGALVNATLDALAPFGIQHMDMPFTPSRIWQAIEVARTSKAPTN